MAIIIVKEYESFDLALRKFKKLCDNMGIFNEIIKHTFYIKNKKKYKKKYVN